MSEARFSLLTKCSHFVDNSVPIQETVTATEKRLWKIKGFYDAIVMNFHTVYTPERFVAVDESLMLWKGRLPMKQYIRTKAARWGLKSYELCESDSGYIWNSIIHTGTGDDMMLDNSNDNRTTSRIVLTLMRDLFGMGYRVFIDNFYSSPTLFSQLSDLKTDAVGTVKLNSSGMPPSFKVGGKMVRGTTKAAYCKRLMALRWGDKNDVSMLSNFSSAEMEEVTTWSGTREKPQVVIQYNKSMGGVDVADQMLTSYPMERKRKRKWYQKMFRHLLNQATLNSYILHKKYSSSPMNHLEFQKKLFNSLIEKNHSIEVKPKLGRPSSVPDPLRLTARHFARKIPPTEKTSAPERNCSVCSAKTDVVTKKSVRQRSRYECADCDVGLCIDPCFKIYHTQKTSKKIPKQKKEKRKKKEKKEEKKEEKNV